jgi:hypothetical protein
MHDVPKDLMKQIKDLEQQFTVDTAKLHEIVDKFQSELEKGKLPLLFPCAGVHLNNPHAVGLSKEGGSIVC